MLRLLQYELGVVPGHVAQSITFLTTDASLAADPGVASLIPAGPITFVEIDHEIISTVILLIQEGLMSVTSESMCTNNWLTACSSLARIKVWFPHLFVLFN